MFCQRSGYDHTRSGQAAHVVKDLFLVLGAHLRAHGGSGAGAIDGGFIFLQWIVLRQWQSQPCQVLQHDPGIEAGQRQS
jgi:hypothetical protein